jgi:hypothetical protein
MGNDLIYSTALSVESRESRESRELSVISL